MKLLNLAAALAAAFLSYALPAAAQSISYSPNTLPLAGSCGAVTVSTPCFDLSQTLNNAGATFDVLKLAVTKTAANNNSNLLHITQGGVDFLRLDVLGNLDVPSGGIFLASGNALQFDYGVTNSYSINKSGSNLVFNTAGQFSFNSPAFTVFDSAGTTAHFNVDPGGSGVRINGVNSIGFTSGGANASAPDVRLYRDAAAVLALRNGVNAQQFNVYNTYTDASNYERATINWSSNVLQIGSQMSGTGVNTRALSFVTNATNRLDYNSTNSSAWTAIGNFYGGASAANYLGLLGSGSNPSLVATGSSTDITINLTPKGAGGVNVTTGSLGVQGTANTISATGSASASPVTIAATGSDTDIGITLSPKGAGQVSTNGKSLSVGAGQVLGGDIVAGTTKLLAFSGRSQFTSPADGTLQMQNTAGSGFTMLQWGGATNVFPGIKRSSTTLAARLADDTADANFTAGIFAASNYIQTNPLTVGALATCNAGAKGARQFVTDATQAFSSANFGVAVTAGGANNVPVVCDGTSWKIGRADLSPANDNLPVAYREQADRLWSAFG